ERRDLLKVIVSRNTFDPTLLEQPKLPDDLERMPVNRSAEAPKGALNRLLHRVQVHRGAEVPQEEDLDDWLTYEVVMTVRRPRLRLPIPNDGATIDLCSTLQIKPHPALQMQARLISPSHAGQLLAVHPLPPLLEAASKSLFLVPARGADPGLNVLELSDIANPRAITPRAITPRAVTPRTPLELVFSGELLPGEALIPVAHDGEFYLPLGYALPAPDGLHIALERLPEQNRQEETGNSGPVCIFFQRIATPLVDAGRETDQTQDEDPSLPDWLAQSDMLPLESRAATFHALATTGIGLAINRLTPAPWSQATLWSAARHLGNWEIAPAMTMPQGQTINASEAGRARALYARLGYPLETGSGNEYTRG
ncbi:MAG: hypothetical protein ACM3PY_04820, partial [Omnitrophica WOR_2 bacterium]